MGASGKGIAVPSPCCRELRAWVLGGRTRAGVPVEKRMIRIDAILSADEVILTNSSWGVLPVIRVEAGTSRERDAGQGVIAAARRGQRRTDAAAGSSRGSGCVLREQ